MKRALQTASVYAVLVGLPLAGLLLILEKGAAIAPPDVVVGDWHLEGSPEAGACLGLADEMPLVIEQSGRFLRVRAADAVADGRADSDRVQAALDVTTGPCPGVTMQLDSRVAADVLAGTVSASCGACASVSFRARRAPEGL